MAKPLVALMGRPNVGKSTLFNRIVGKKMSIVEDFAGVTRDRVYCDADWNGKVFTLIDTGGLELGGEDAMWKHIRAQAETAAEIADCIVLVADGRAGVTADDAEVAALLRKCRKPVIVAVNKLDNNEVGKSFDFYELGLGAVVPISAEQGKGIGDLLDEIAAELPAAAEAEEAGEKPLAIAVVGKPNAGKSSLTNRILGYERVIVSDVAGTTRDAVDTDFSRDGKKYTLIDTAGMRKKAGVEQGVEQYSVLRALAAVRRADVVLIVVDAQAGITEQDVRICGYVHEQGKPSVVVVNKWDAVEKDTHTMHAFRKKFDEALKFMDYYEAQFVSAATGLRVAKLLEAAQLAHSEAAKRVPTGVLNEVVSDAIAAVEAPSKNGRRLKIFYVTQASVCPPVFVFFVNDAKLMHFSYERYLENALRKSFGFRGTPIRLVIRTRGEER